MSEAVTYSGFWSDHGVANRIPVDVILRDRTLFLTLRDGRKLDFPRSLVSLSAPIRGGRRILRLGDHGQVELEHARILDSIFPIQASSLLSKLERLERREWIAWLGATLLPLTLAAGFKFGVPMIARGIAATMPQSVSDRMTMRALEILEKSGRMKSSSIDPYRQYEIEYKLKHILRNRPVAKLINVRFIDGRGGIGENAFALPNGTIAITDQLISRAESDSEILAVLAHEVGHVENRHGLRSVLSQSGISGMLAMLSGSTAARLVESSIAGQLLSLQYSRNMELEADDYAIALLREARINPRAFANIFRNDTSMQVRGLYAVPTKLRVENGVVYLKVDGYPEVKIDSKGGDRVIITANGNTQTYSLKVGEKLVLRSPAPVEISRSRDDDASAISGYLRTHPKDSERVKRATKAALEFEQTGR